MAGLAAGSDARPLPAGVNSLVGAARWLIIVLLGPLAADAQRVGAVPRIGLLGVPPPGDATYQALLQGLQDLGYTEGKTVLIEFRLGEPPRLPALASEL